MDATQIIILTSIINIILDGIIVGVVIFVVQRRIDHSFAEKIEQFKAQLQYSTFEQQTKFVSTHTKRLEMLQMLYKKFTVFHESFDYTIRQISYVENSFTDKVTMKPADYERMGKELSDFRKYFVENRLFLTEELVSEIERIYSSSITLYEELREILPFEAGTGNPDFDPYGYLKKYLSTSELFADYINKESEEIGFDFADVLTMMDNIMYRQVKKLENIYKSVAGDKHIS